MCSAQASCYECLMSAPGRETKRVACCSALAFAAMATLAAPAWAQLAVSTGQPVTVTTTGAVVDVTVTTDGSDTDAYVNYGPAGRLPVLPMTSDVVQYGVQYQRAVPVPPGMYYVVIDTTAGAASPTSAAVINYSIQIGDAP